MFKAFSKSHQPSWTPVIWNWSLIFGYAENSHKTFKRFVLLKFLSDLPRRQTAAFVYKHTHIYIFINIRLYTLIFMYMRMIKSACCSYTSSSLCWGIVGSLKQLSNVFHFTSILRVSAIEQKNQLRSRVKFSALLYAYVYVP